MRLGYKHCCFGKAPGNFVVAVKALPVFAASMAAVAPVAGCTAEGLEPDMHAVVAAESVEAALARALIHNCSLRAAVAGFAAVKLAADYRCNKL